MVSQRAIRHKDEPINLNCCSAFQGVSLAAMKNQKYGFNTTVNDQLFTALEL